jgi:hypothetical protein
MWNVPTDPEQESKLQETITKTEALTKELADSRKTSERLHHLTTGLPREPEPR